MQEKIENKEIIEFFENFGNGKDFFDFPDELIKKMTVEHGLIIREYVSNPRFFKLPTWEVKFFEWLKTNDNRVWNDLWGDLSSPMPEYIVSVDFLPMLLRHDGRGFPICDLLDNDNYYFTDEHFFGDEAKIFMESSGKALLANNSISTAQLLLLEISAGPIDLWHFAYKHKLDIDDCKNAVESLKEEKLLVHLKTAEQLANFVSI